MPRPDAAVDVALRPVPWVRAGVTRTRSSSAVPEVTDEEVAVVPPGVLRGYAEVVAPTPRVGGFGLDLALGAGVERTTVEVRGQPFRGNTQTVEYAIAQTASNRFLQATAELVYCLDAHEVVSGDVREVSWGTRCRF